MISGILQYFEGRDTYRYFVSVWNAMDNDAYFDSIVLHICRWHFFKTVIKQMKLKYKGKDNSALILNELGKIARRLAAMSTLESFERVVADIIVIIGSPKLTGAVKRRIRLLNTATAKLGTFIIDEYVFPNNLIASKLHLNWLLSSLTIIRQLTRISLRLVVKPFSKLVFTKFALK